MYIHIFKTRTASFIGGLVLFLVLVLIVVLIFEYKYIGNFFPGVSLQGESLSGRSFAEISGGIRAQAEKLESDGLVFTVRADADNYLISVPQVSYGLTPDASVDYFIIGDWESSLEEAYQKGRRGGLLSRARDQVDLLVNGFDIDLGVVIREDAMKSLLKRELDLILPKESPASFKKVAGGWEIEPEVVGEYVDLEGVADLIRYNLRSLSGEALVVESGGVVPDTTEESLGEYLSFVTSDLVNKTVRFRYNGYNAWLSGGDLVSWLNTSRDGGGGVRLGVNKEKLSMFVKNKIGLYIENPAENSRFRFVDGQLVEIAKGRAGSAIDFVLLARELEEAIDVLHDNFIAPLIGEDVSSVLVLDLGVIEQEPKITSETINRYEIKELVATAKTSFAGSSKERKNNIKVAADKLNGLLIGPGEEFSAVNEIGYVTEEEGYEKEYVIKGDESIKELGGGLCQLATTLFRTALDGGLPITERQNHSYVVGYYGPGLDATIYGPHPDLKFVNDTGSYLLLQSKVEGNNLVFELYGQDDDRVVTIGEPEIYDRIAPPVPKYIPSFDLAMGKTKCTETARYGMTTEAEYVVELADGTSRTQVFKSIYRPWRKVCLIGVGGY